jgi:hypothetical protein
MPSRKDLKEFFDPHSEIIRVKRLRAGSLIVELRIGGSKRGSQRYVRLTSPQARTLGCSLIALADEIEPSKREIMPGWH